MENSISSPKIGNRLSALTKALNTVRWWKSLANLFFMLAQHLRVVKLSIFETSMRWWVCRLPSSLFHGHAKLPAVENLMLKIISLHNLAKLLSQSFEHFQFFGERSSCWTRRRVLSSSRRSEKEEEEKKSFFSVWKIPLDNENLNDWNKTTICRITFLCWVPWTRKNYIYSSVFKCKKEEKSIFLCLEIFLFCVWRLSCLQSFWNDDDEKRKDVMEEKEGVMEGRRCGEGESERRELFFQLLMPFPHHLASLGIYNEMNEQSLLKWKAHLSSFTSFLCANS